MYTTEIYQMNKGYYYVIRDKNYKMVESSTIYKTKTIARRKAKTWKKNHTKK